MELSIDHQGSLPLHAQVERLLRELIEKEEYQMGKTLPGEIELSKKLAISRSTVRQAIKKLESEGLLIRKRKAGTKVAPKPVSSKSNNWLSFSQEMKVRGIEIKNFELHISWVEADIKLSNYFDIQVGRKILKMEKVRGTLDEPFVYFVSYFHPRIGMTGEENFKQPLYEMLEQEHSVIATLSKEEISATTADSFISKKLGIKKADAVLFRRRFVYDQGKRLFEFNLGYYKANTFTYTVESFR